MDYAENHCALFLGTPFDPLSKKYVTTPRNDFRTSGILKKFDRGAGLKKTDKPVLTFMQTLCDLRDRHKFPTLTLPIGRTDFRWTGLEEASCKSDLYEGHIEKIAAAGQNDLAALNNAFVFLARNHLYISHRVDNSPVDFDHQWIGKALSALKKEAAQLPHETRLSQDANDFDFISASMIREGSLALQIPEAHFELREIMRLAIANLSDSPASHDFLFRVAWYNAYLCAHPFLFVAALYKFNVKYDRSKYPYINHALIDLYNDYLALKVTLPGNRSVSYYDVCTIHSGAIARVALDTEDLVDTGFRYKDENAIRAIATKASEFASYFETIPSTNLSLANFFNVLLGSLQKAANLPCDERIEEFTKRLQSLYSNLLNACNELSATALNDRAIAQELIESGPSRIEETIENLSSLWSDTIILLENLNITDREVKKAMSDGESRIEDDDWFEELKSLREKRAKVNADYRERYDALDLAITNLEAAMVPTMEALDHFSTDAVVKRAQHTGAPSGDPLLLINDLQDELSQTKQALEDAKSDLVDSQNEIKVLTEKLAATKRAQNDNVRPVNTSPSTHYYSGLLSKVLNERFTLFDIVEALHEVHSESCELSPRAWDSVKANTDYNRYGFVFDKLNTLMSREFIDAYTQGGSQAAFKFFTKKTLSFNESEQTMSQKDARTFVFEDGVSRVCDAHLRLGSSGNAQHTLRIYFSIEEGQLYIGEIATHLPVSQGF